MTIFPNTYRLTARHSIPPENDSPTLSMCFQTVIKIISFIVICMINTQLGRRNLPLAQRLAVMDKFKKKIQEQAANKANESRSKFHANQYRRYFLQMETIPK